MAKHLIPETGHSPNLQAWFDWMTRDHSAGGLSGLLAGMNGWVISGEDPIAAAKVFRDATKDFKKAEKFVVQGGFFDGDVLDAVQLDKVADLPGREQLLSTLLATLQEAPRQVMGIIEGPARDLMYLLKNFENKLAEAEEGAA